MSARHERRRRMLVDESLSSGDATEAPVRIADEGGASSATQAAYSTTVRQDCDRRLLDLLPHGRTSLALVVSTALLAVGALIAADIWRQSLAELLGATELAVLQLDAPGSGCQWLATTLLAGCAPLSWLLYSLRRHRVDDYSGRYRIWLWIALACLLGSMLEGSDLGSLARAVCRRVCAAGGLEATLFANACGALLLGAVALRLLIEVRHSRGAVAAWTVCAVAWLTSTAFASPWLAEAVKGFPATARACWLIGYVFVLATLLVYARFVRLQIDGTVALPQRRRKRVVKPADPVEAERSSRPRGPWQVRTDLDSAPAPRQSETAPRHDSGEESETLSVEALAAGGLSRAERRRLRRHTRMAG
jgi:hypothetical protein